MLSLATFSPACAFFRRYLTMSTCESPPDRSLSAANKQRSVAASRSWLRRTPSRDARETPSAGLHLLIYLPCALDADAQPRWNCYESSAQSADSAQFPRELYRLIKDLGGGGITIDIDKNCVPQIKMDYSEFLIYRADRHFAFHPPHGMVLATNCSSNSPLSVTHHRRHEEPVNGVPDTLYACLSHHRVC